MLKRSRYSRLRDDSLTSPEDPPERTPPPARDVCLASDPASPRPGTPAQLLQSTLRDFIPRVASIRLQSPLSLRGPGGRTVPARDAPGRPGGPSTRTRPGTLQRTASLPWTPGCAGCCLKAPPAVGDCPVGGAADRVVHHHIEYMGSVEVTRSMRSLDFNSRMQVTREAIRRLCERRDGKTAVKSKRPVCAALSAVLGPINLQQLSRRSIFLTVSTDSLTLTAACSLQKIAQHPMQTISFASGGDAEMPDYIAYVAKDRLNRRACHILECPQGRACEVIDSIGRAFETRFRQLLSQPASVEPPGPRSAGTLCRKCPPEDTRTDRAAGHGYSNVTPPGRTPPAGGVEDVRPTEGVTARDARKVCSARSPSLYENCSVPASATAPPADPSVTARPAADPAPPDDPERTEDRIRGQGWFHGRLGRREAESLLSRSGDFLVRESSSACGQYVLSGMEGATVRHLLLVDPQGQVRTRDQLFLSVGHLVRFHMDSRTPIVSGSSQLRLNQPVLRTQ